MSTCGHANVKGARFCATCGASLATGSTAKAAPDEVLTVVLPGLDRSPEPAPPKTKPRERTQRKRGLLIATIIGLVVALAASTFAVVAVINRDDASAEVYLEAAKRPGANPFTKNVANQNPTLTNSYDAKGKTGTGVVLTVAGTEPGLYGGTQNNQSCDPEKLVKFLASEPAKAAAWAGVLGITQAQIPKFVAGLTPAILRADTRVTNHGFANGKATILQSVLQAGTAVLVDNHGIPRVRCSCGNPLTEPEPVQATYTGTPWPNFDDHHVVAITNGPPTDTFTLTDPTTGSTYIQPTGTGGSTSPAIVYKHLRPPSPDQNGTIDFPYPVIEGGPAKANGALRGAAQEVVNAFNTNFDPSAVDPAGCPTCAGRLRGRVNSIGVSNDYISVLWIYSSMFSYSLSDTPSARSLTISLDTARPISFGELFTGVDVQGTLMRTTLTALESNGYANPDFFRHLGYAKIFGSDLQWAATPDGLVLSWDGPIVAEEASGSVAVTLAWPLVSPILSDVGHSLQRIGYPRSSRPPAEPRQFLAAFLRALKDGDQPLLRQFGPKAVIDQFRRDHPSDSLKTSSVVWGSDCEIKVGRGTCELLLDSIIVGVTYREVDETGRLEIENLQFNGDAN